MNFITGRCTVTGYGNSFVEVDLDIDEGDVKDAVDIGKMLDVIGIEVVKDYFDLEEKE